MERLTTREIEVLTALGDRRTLISIGSDAPGNLRSALKKLRWGTAQYSDLPEGDSDAYTRAWMMNYKDAAAELIERHQRACDNAYRAYWDTRRGIA